MSLPRVVVAASMSVDGRLALGRDQPLLDEGTFRRWQDLQPPSEPMLRQARDSLLERLYQPQAMLEGSGSFVTSTVGPLTGDPAAAGVAPDELYTDFLPRDVVERPGRKRWFAVVDSRGRVRWSIKSQDEADLLVMVARATPAAYLMFLRQQRIPYLVVGDERVELTGGLRRMRERLGVTCVVAQGGGGLNGALLRAGLVDEVQLLVFPAAIGGAGVPSVFDGPPLSEGDSPARLRLLSARVEGDGMLWLRYEVPRS
jgi:2,5-diamino-6-(ribosylamino)-4(3H)-pyrimidinone 5'-phosphate reductase